MFVRISVDQVATISDLERVVTAGEVRRDDRPSFTFAVATPPPRLETTL